MAPDTPVETRRDLALPPIVASVSDVGQLLRELEAIDDALLQLGLRAGGTAVKLPKTSPLMDQIVQFYQVELLKPSDRAEFKQYLTTIKEKAPVLHMSFSADPTPAFIEKLMVWLRREIHPQALLTIGLQPTIGAGCVLRTTNRHFDLSLRQDLANKRQLLLKELVSTEVAS